MIDTMIRCHVKTEARYLLFLKSVDSWYDKQLNELGDLIIIDDQSPNEFEEKIRNLCSSKNIKYIRTEYTASTINGLYHSLKYAQTFPVLCCVDDVIFGAGIKDELIRIIKDCIPNLNNWASIGLFTCYEGRQNYKELGLWNIPNSILYALVCNIFSKDISDILIDQYERSKVNYDLLSPVEKHDIGFQDDIWFAKTATRFDMLCFNTFKYDYALHTGMNNRSFISKDEGSSNYQTPCFIGE